MPRGILLTTLVLASLVSCGPKEGPCGLKVGDEVVKPFMGMIVEFEDNPPMVVTKITGDTVELSRLGRVVAELTHEEVEHLFDQGQLGNLTRAKEDGETGEFQPDQ